MHKYIFQLSPNLQLLKRNQSLENKMKQLQDQIHKRKQSKNNDEFNNNLPTNITNSALQTTGAKNTKTVI